MSTPRRSVGLFLVERYLPTGDLDEISATVAAAAAACSGQRSDGAPLRYLHSTFIPGDDTCFCVFEAASAQDVNALNVAINFRVDRISPAVSFETRPNPSSPIRQRSVDHPRKRLP